MRIDDVLQRIQGEFVEMPGLRLTAAQALGLQPPMPSTEKKATEKRGVAIFFCVCQWLSVAGTGF